MTPVDEISISRKAEALTPVFKKMLEDLITNQRLKVVIEPMYTDNNHIMLTTVLSLDGSAFSVSNTSINIPQDKELSEELYYRTTANRDMICDLRDKIDNLTSRIESLRFAT